MDALAAIRPDDWTMAPLAAIRPDDWSLALFFHVLGAMVMVGGLVLALVYLVAAFRGDSAPALRRGFLSLLYAAIPGFIVMRVGAEWIYAKEGLDDLPSDPNWIGIGYGISDLGLLLLVLATVVAGLAARRAQPGAGGEARVSSGGASVRLATTIVSALLVMYVFAIWAMTTKPS
jgi:hypothetical protein